jgi:IS4 transposase
MSQFYDVSGSLLYISINVFAPRRVTEREICELHTRARTAQHFQSLHPLSPSQQTRLRDERRVNEDTHTHTYNTRAVNVKRIRKMPPAHDAQMRSAQESHLSSPAPRKLVAI